MTTPPHQKNRPPTAGFIALTPDHYGTTGEEEYMQYESLTYGVLSRSNAILSKGTFTKLPVEECLVPVLEKAVMLKLINTKMTDVLIVTPPTTEGDMPLSNLKTVLPESGSTKPRRVYHTLLKFILERMPSLSACPP
eukprot:Lankesteria_metandrocarpae@DN4550_c0_g1_i1.p2